MDGAYRSTRKFPAYTTAQLEAAVADIIANQTGSNACMMVVAMGDEIDRRKSGESVAFAVPQIPALKVR